MFVPFFSKRKPKKEEAPQKATERLPEEEKQLLQNIERLKGELTKEAITEATLANRHEELALAYSALGKDEKAIEHLEKSLTLLPSIGEGYKVLLSLYNQKRKEAARAGEDEQIDYYMRKMDEMRQLARTITVKR